MKHFIIEVLDTAEQITPEKAFDILTFAFRGEVLNVSEFRPTMRAADLLRAAVSDGESSPSANCQ